MKTTSKTESNLKEKSSPRRPNMLQKGSKKGARKATPASRIAFEDNFEDRNKLVGKSSPKAPKSLFFLITPLYVRSFWEAVLHMRKTCSLPRLISACLPACLLFHTSFLPACLPACPIICALPCLISACLPPCLLSSLPRLISACLLACLPHHLLPSTPHGLFLFSCFFAALGFDVALHTFLDLVEESKPALAACLHFGSR